jgi:hypothetical protein
MVVNMIKLSDDEIQLLIRGLMNFHELLVKERRPKYFREEKARDLKLLPDLIDKLNHAKNVTASGHFKHDQYDYRFLITDNERKLMGQPQPWDGFFHFVPENLGHEILAMSEEAKADVIWWLAIRCKVEKESRAPLVREAIAQMIEARKEKTAYRRAKTHVPTLANMA